MARRRYLSTTISTDAAVGRLVKEYGDFAGLLYTWLIPHAEDDGRIAADPEELLYIVVPNMRTRTVEDISRALAGMDALGLVEWDRAGGEIRFPESFYKYQAYINRERRSRARQKRVAPDCCSEGNEGNGAGSEPPSGGEGFGADRRNAPNLAQNSASFSSSVSSSSSSAEERGKKIKAAAGATAPPPPTRAGQADAGGRAAGANGLPILDGGNDRAGCASRADVPDTPDMLDKPGKPERTDILDRPNGFGRSGNAGRAAGSRHGKNAPNAGAGKAPARSWRRGDPLPASATIEWLRDAWNEIMPEYGIPPMRELTKKRRRQFRARVAEHSARASPDYWLEAFERITASGFLCGLTRPQPNGKRFVIRLPWLLERAEALSRLMEGFYDDARPEALGLSDASGSPNWPDSPDLPGHSVWVEVSDEPGGLKQTGGGRDGRSGGEKAAMGSGSGHGR